MGKKERRRKRRKIFGEKICDPWTQKRTEKEKEENIWRKYLAHGGEDEQRRKRRKIWREKSFGDTDDQNQQ